MNPNHRTIRSVLWGASFTVLLAGVVCPMYADTVLLNDTFADGQRDNQSLPSSAAWFLLNDTTATPTATVNPEGELVWADKAGSYSALIAFFTPSGQPQSLGIGDSLKLEFRLAPDTLSTPGNQLRVIRVGVMNSGGKRLTADNLHHGSPGQVSGTTFNDWRGYSMNTSVDAVPWDNQLELYERSGANQALFSSGAFTQLGAATTGTFAELQFVPFELTITRRATEIEISGRAADATIGPAKDSAALVTAFDALAIFVQPQISGLRVDDVKVTYIPNPSPSDDPNLVTLTETAFGKLPLDAPLPVTGRVSVRNTGASQSLTIQSQSTITGPDSTNYSVITPLPLTIAAGATGVVEVAFNPVGRSGDFFATLELRSNDPSEPVSPVTLDARYFSSGAELLTNPGFEMTDTFADWAQAGAIWEVPGLVSASAKAAFLTAGALLGRTNMAVPGTFQLEFRLAIQDTAGAQAFMLWLKTFPGFDSLNPFFYLRYESGILEVMTNINAQAWSGDLGLGSLEPSVDGNGDGDLADPEDTPNVYRLRLTAYNWGSENPTYDLALSEKNSDAFSHQATGLTGFAGGGGGGAAPPINLIFAAQNNPGYWIDEVRLTAGLPPGQTFAITQITRDAASGNVTLTWQSDPGVSYGIESTTNLVSAWTSLGSDVPAAAGSTTSFTHITGDTTRFYRVVRR